MTIWADTLDFGVVALADVVDRANFGLTIDLSHLPLLGETSGQAIRAAGRHLIHAHIGNCVAQHPDSKLYGDFHPRFGHPEGSTDVAEVATFLRELSVLGYWEQVRVRCDRLPIVTMEIKPCDESSETVLANGKRTFMRAWSLAQQPVWLTTKPG
jgi:sugar phosphate isomerase/epimerase